MGQDESLMAEASRPPSTLSERSLQAVANHITSGAVKRIVVLTGAGISTAAGIPDFRSPKTGLYHNLARLNLPYAEAVFDISYFRERPEPFYILAKELYPGHFHPTVSHAFIALLARKRLLSRLFTQNIDCLERRAGVPADAIVEAHGSFATQRCIECAAPFPDADMRAHVLGGRVPRCPACPARGLVKPDITFFGEALPRAFSEQSHAVAMADLVLVVGTSLSVFPFARLPEMARDAVPRVLFNLERVGSLGARADDVLELGACDDGVRRLADLLGWRTELEALWRDVVGDEEAERQLRSRTERDEEVEDEVQKLAEEVEAILAVSDDKEQTDILAVSDEREQTAILVVSDVKEEEEEKREKKEGEKEEKENLDATTQTGTQLKEQQGSEKDDETPTDKDPEDNTKKDEAPKEADAKEEGRKEPYTEAEDQRPPEKAPSGET
ncbi:NAD-dependent protein deacetylase hst2-1 [Escovopsis weberi]|uniref:NAD-dependent protein deacetylase hst2-1 n=1 Tax=Escovopsis weberi TaxID=150374 RepID=A0A0M8N574_ESCWE|nr:NAD-dependent protein deacetylase hst2-1 [Escovopsis weberi]